MKRTVLSAIATTDGLTRLGIVANAALRFLQRWVLVLATVFFVSSAHGRAFGIGAVLIVLYTLHGGLRAWLRKRVYAHLVGATVRALVVARSVKSPDATPADEQQAVFEGLFRSEQLLAESIPEFVANALASVSLVLFLARLRTPRLLLLGGAALASAAIASALVRGIAARAEERSRAAFLPVVDAVVAAVRGRMELAASGRGDDFARATDALSDVWRRVSARGDRIAALAGRTPVVAAAVAVAVAVGVVHLSGGVLDARALGDAAVFASIVPSFGATARALVEIARATAYLAPLHALLANAVPDASGGTPLAKPPSRVVVDRVTFRYSDAPGARAVLRELSFVWQRGTPLVIAGPNGAGKSTLLRVLLGLAAPSEGSVRIDEADLADLDVATWRRSVAYLAQRPYVSERATVRETVRVFALDAPDDVIVTALARTDILPALRELSPTDPLAVRLGVLSIGQRQRVALARLLCHDAPVVLLDEPDANLDAAGIRLVASLVRELAATKMVAVVAHTSELLGADEGRVTLGANA